MIFSLSVMDLKLYVLFSYRTSIHPRFPYVLETDIAFLFCEESGSRLKLLVTNYAIDPFLPVYKKDISSQMLFLYIFVCRSLALYLCLYLSLFHISFCLGHFLIRLSLGFNFYFLQTFLNCNL